MRISDLSSHEHGADLAFTKAARQARDRAFFFLLCCIAVPAFFFIFLPPVHNSTLIAAIATALFSLLIDALPFLLGGSILSVIIHEYVPARVLQGIFGKSALRGIVSASLCGLVLPLCECGTVPLIRTLLKARVRPAVAMTAFFSMPLVNPIVIVASFYAFSADPAIAWARILIGWALVILLGLICLVFEKWLARNIVPEAQPDAQADAQADPRPYAQPEAQADARVNVRRGFRGFIRVMEHSAEEIYQTGRFLVAGALIASFFQVFVHIPRGFAQGGSAAFVEVLAGVFLAFILSLCSTSDAFVARSFWAQVNDGAILGFLLMGPLLHLRNLLLLARIFRPRALVFLAASALVPVIAIGVAINLAGGFK